MLQEEYNGSDEESEGKEPAGKRRRINEDALERKRERRIWDENR